MVLNNRIAIIAILFLYKFGHIGNNKKKMWLKYEKKNL